MAWRVLRPPSPPLVAPLISPPNPRESGTLTFGYLSPRGDSVEAGFLGALVPWEPLRRLCGASLQVTNFVLRARPRMEAQEAASTAKRRKRYAAPDAPLAAGGEADPPAKRPRKSVQFAAEEPEVAREGARFGWWWGGMQIA